MAQEDAEDYTCQVCGSPLSPSQFGGYYCKRCYANGLTITYDPNTDLLKHQVREPERETLYKGPYAEWAVENNPHQSPEGPPPCKLCGSEMVKSRTPGQFYCSTCWQSGINVSYDPATGMVKVYKADKSLPWEERQMYQGPYESWQPNQTEPSPPQTSPPSNVNEVKQTIDEEDSNNPFRDTTTTTTTTTNDDDDTDNITDATDNAVDDAVTASGEYANGQPEADLVQGDIRIYSEARRAEIPVDTEGIFSGIAIASDDIEPGVAEYVNLQDFEYLARRGDPTFNDILNSPVVLDSAADDPDTFCQNVAQNNPYYDFTEIGAQGFIPNISQANALHVIANTQKNLILCFPTGAGKTACVEAQIAKGLNYGNTPDTQGQMAMKNPVAIYVAPARALAAQTAKDFSDPDHPFAQNGWDVRIERGVKAMDSPDVIDADDEDADAGVVADDRIDKLSKTKDPSIIVATPERLLSCLMNPRQHPWIDRITTMAFDEGHLIGDRSRGAKFEGEQIHLYRDYYRRIKNTPAGRSASIVFLSATMENALELSAWQGNATDDPENWTVVWGDYQPVPIETDFETYSLGEDGEEDELILSMLRDIISTDNYAIKVDEDGNEEEVMRPTLAFFHVKRRARLMRKMAERGFRECPSCGYVFEAPLDQKGWPIDAEDCSCPMCSESKDIEPWIIDFHHAGVPSGKQDEFVKKFNSGESKVLAATSTLAAGVNTGAMSVYIGGTTRGPEDVSVSSIHQMSGRAGRQSFAHMYPNQAARVKVYTENDRATYHKRRLQAGAYLESMMADPVQLVDNLLRAVKMGSISNFQDAGNYVGSSLAYFQAAVDRLHGMNVRQALSEVSDSIKPNNTDRIEWIVVPDANCTHDNVEVNEEETRRSIEETQNDNGTSVIDWHMICRNCGAEGLMEQEMSIKTDQDFIQMIDSSLRDLIGAGFLVVEPDGNLKITPLGRDIVKYHMESATAVDIVRNLEGFQPQDMTPMGMAIALGDVRTNNDEERGAFITAEQATFCSEALNAMGLTPETPKPSAKVVQCIYWSLNGVDPKDVPDCLKADYMGVPDEYGGPFALGFAALSAKAKWFEGAGDVLEMLMVQLKEQVSPRQAPFAAADGIDSEKAYALVKAKFTNLNDVASSPESDPRFGDFCYYLWGWDQEQRRTKPSRVGGATNNWERQNFGKWARRMKNSAKRALRGQKFSGFDESGKPKYKPDASYHRTIEQLNGQKFLSKLGIKSKRASSQGWYKIAKENTSSKFLLPHWSEGAM